MSPRDVQTAERAWAAFQAHRRTCKSCYDLAGFVALEPVATDGASLPPELCDKGRGLLNAWLTHGTRGVA